MTEEEKLNQIRTAINKSGYVLEYSVSTILKNRGWDVITNRYYLDDVEKKPREIDVVASMEKRIDDVSYFTILLISCKKSEEYSWVFLDRNHMIDPGMYLPLNFVATDHILEFIYDDDTKIDRILNEIDSPEAEEKILHPDRYIFAAKEMDLKKAKFRSDKDGIYESISTLIKSNDYERKKIREDPLKNKFVSFFMLTIFDGEMYSVPFPSDPLVPTKIEKIMYYNRHIVDMTERWMSVRILSSRVFEDEIFVYESYHNRLAEKLGIRRNKFFNYIFLDPFRIDVIWPIFKDAVTSEMRQTQGIRSHIWMGYDYLSYQFDKVENILTIFIEAEAEPGKELLKSKKLKDILKEQLAYWFKFTGEFQIKNVRDKTD